MKHGLSSTVFALILFICCFRSAYCNDKQQKSRFEKIKEIVAKNMDILGPMLKRGPSKEMIDFYLKHEAKKKKKRESDFEKKKKKYAKQTKTMFLHAYNSYMMHAFPADELMPLSCKGRVRGLTQSRGEVDDALGRYMLTVVDSLDTLIVMKELELFEDAVKLVIRGLSFDTDITVNLFEANIRILGGLLGGHASCLYLQSVGKLSWYSNELLMLSVDLADRFLPAFDTPTGLPVPKINLRHGTHGLKDNETCTACAGTLFLEMAALSRYTGNSSYESLARVALNFLYERRFKASDLPGSTMNVNSGHWIRKDSGVGAGIDSYYEYLLKGYLITGDKRLWDMFSTQYEATKKYLKKNKYMTSVHAGAPKNRVKEHQDALQAFWPGLQVLAGDVDEAAEVHSHYVQVSGHNQNTLPESFLLTGQLYWPQYYIRPELVESNYILYKATRDPKYVDTAVTILNAIENRCKVVCGYAALKHVASGELEDRMDSFVLAETFKYFYLTFAEEEDIGIPIDDYVLTTEAHLIPLHVQFFSKEQVNASKEVCPDKRIYAWSWLEDGLFGRYFTNALPSHICLMEDQPYNYKIKQKKSKEEPRTITSSLKASNFDYKNPEHVAVLRSMGIHIEFVDGEKLQLVHNAGTAYSEQLGVEGVIFMKEITEHAKEMSRVAQQQSVAPRELFVQSLLNRETATFEAGRAQFGPDLTDGMRVAGTAELAQPADGCSVIINRLAGKVAIVHRGNCMFVDKVRHAEQAGAVGVVIIDNAEENSALLAMSGDGTDDVNISSIFINKVLLGLMVLSC
ncbi:hypothetical protein ACHWQZ_G016615 [Mnemiopsis leidyi]